MGAGDLAHEQDDREHGQPRCGDGCDRSDSALGCFHNRAAGCGEYKEEGPEDLGEKTAPFQRVIGKGGVPVLAPFGSLTEHIIVTVRDWAGGCVGCTMGAHHGTRPAVETKGIVMDVLHSVRVGSSRLSDSVEVVATPGRRPRLLRVLDPLDVAGRAARAVLPSHATPVEAQALYFMILGVFVAAEVLEPPVAVLMAVGHLMGMSHNRFVREAGDAFDDAA